jgi:signal transduction histidine kinase
VWLAVWDTLTEPVWLMNSEFRIQRCNQAAQELVRHPVVGRCCWEVVHGAREPVPDCPFSKMCLSGCGESAELQLGSRWYNCTVDPIFDGHHRVSGAVHVLWDITGRKLVDTERKQTEQLLRKTNRRLQAVRECHAAMLRARTEKELLDAICRIIVRSGSGRMAWVGFAKMDARKSIQPVAQAGLSRDFIKQTRVTWADIPRGRGPTGTAIRTGKPCLCRDTFADPGYAPWRTAARRRGYGSLIALPLLAGQHCFGALVIHARQVDAFDVRDQLLFTDLANDLAFGINTLRLRAEHERLEKEIIKSSEREQARIGRDLHDGLCQVLVGAKFRSAYLQKLAAARSPAIAREARALEEILDQAVQQARNVAGGLNPVRVTPAGLAAALRKLAEDVDASHRAHCFCQFPAPVTVPDPQVAYQLYRIAQEAVQNALRHGGAKNISITLAREDKRVVLTVKDDGSGIRAAGKKSGMGINNMQTRARLVGGSLVIRRRKHGGTAVSCELPANQNPSHDPFPKEHAGPAQAPDFSGG